MARMSCLDDISLASANDLDQIQADHCVFETCIDFDTLDVERGRMEVIKMTEIGRKRMLHKIFKALIILFVLQISGNVVYLVPVIVKLISSKFLNESTSTEFSIDTRSWILLSCMSVRSIVYDLITICTLKGRLNNRFINTWMFTPLPLIEVLMMAIVTEKFYADVSTLTTISVGSQDSSIALLSLQYGMFMILNLMLTCGTAHLISSSLKMKRQDLTRFSFFQRVQRKIQYICCVLPD